jgi:hypothetical protein
VRHTRRTVDWVPVPVIVLYGFLESNIAFCVAAGRVLEWIGRGRGFDLEGGLDLGDEAAEGGKLEPGVTGAEHGEDEVERISE